MGEPFSALQAALDGLDAFLRQQAPDLTPIVLTYPPTNRDARREYLKSVLDSLDPQLEMIQRLHTRIVDARNVILRRRSMCYMAQHPISALPPEILQIIFSHTYRADEGDTSVGVTLSQVCSDWRQAVHGYRPIWRCVTMRSPEDIRRLAQSLRLSGQDEFSLKVANEDPERDQDDPERSLIESALPERLSCLVWEPSDSITRFQLRYE